MDSSLAEPHRRMARPSLAFAFLPERTRHVFAPDHLARLGELCRVLDERPLEHFDDARARAILAKRRFWSQAGVVRTLTFRSWSERRDSASSRMRLGR
jgi:hypothetical protein